MARYFSEDDISEFRECFSLFARRGTITRNEELTVIMRSLGFSPTTKEIQAYMKKYTKDNQIDFATFLDIMHDHSQTERCLEDILAAFRAMDPKRTGYVSAQELKGVLIRFDEKMLKHEVDRLYHEAGISPNRPIQYDEFVRFLMKPIG